MFLHLLSRPALLATASLLCLAGCGESEAPTGTGGIGGALALNQIVTTGPLNASALDTLVYVSFEQRALVPRTAQWDIALRRYEVRVNGGVTGTGDVTGFNLQNNRTATNAQVLAFTNLNTLAAFDAVREAQLPADTLFAADRLIANANAFLNLGAGIPTANGAAFWKVRTATGGFALVRVASIVFVGRALTAVTFEARTQTGTALGATRTFTITPGTTPVSINLTSGQAVTPALCNWDVQVVPSLYEITLNTACSAGTYPGEPARGFAGTTSAGDAPSYAPFLSVLTGPVPSSIEDPNGPFRYDINGDQRLSPTFNTYLIRNGTRTYKLQVIGYYGTSGAGGFPTIRYARIR